MVPEERTQEGDYGHHRTLTQKGEAFESTLTGLSVRAPIRIIPNERKAKKTAPDFRIIARRNGFEVGAAWIRTARTTGEECISVTLSAPEIGTIYGNIAPASGSDDPAKNVILWNAVS